MLPQETAHWSSDFGRLRRVVPLVAVEAQNEEDVAQALALARAHGVEVTVRGAGHSCNGQSLGRGMVIVNLVRGDAPVRVLPGDLAEVPAGRSWREVEHALNRVGLSVPVLADYLDLSVGGTLAVGCYGIDSIAHGAQVDLVERLRLVRPDGSAVWCSRQEHGELFRWSLAGLGQVGVIVKAVLRTIPHRRVTVLFTRSYASLTALVDGLEWLSGDDGAPALFKAVDSRGRVRATAGATFPRWRDARGARPPAGFASGVPLRRLASARYRFWRSLTVSLWLARFGRSRRVWADYLLSLDALGAFAAHLARRREAGAFGRCLKAVYLVGIRSAGNQFPLEAAAGASGALRFGVGLYCMVPPHDDVALDLVRATLDDCLERCLDLGGRPYLYGVHRLDAERAVRLYGGEYERLCALRRELDPSGLFQAGVLP